MSASGPPPYVAVCGPGADAASEAALRAAADAGRELAAAGAVVVTGGLGGAMEAACPAARRALALIRARR